MSWYTRLNPANNLYIKLFLWFWLATIIMVGSSTWLLSQFDGDVEFRPMRQRQVSDLDEITKKVQLYLENLPDHTELERSLELFGMRNQVAVLLIELKTKRVISGFPRRGQPEFFATGNPPDLPGSVRTKQPDGFADDGPPNAPGFPRNSQPDTFPNTERTDNPGFPRHFLPDLEVFMNFDPESPAISFETSDGTFFGPSQVQMDGKQFLLFVGNPRPPGFMLSISRRQPGTLIGIALLVSGLLCFLFARSLVNPIRQLQHATQQMAGGDLSTRIDGASHRHDEIGRLGRDFNYMSQQVGILLSSQKRLLADISHELRSPLARLQLSIGIVQQQAEQRNDEFLQTSLDRIEKEAAQIEDMIAQVLTLSRLDNPQTLRQKETLEIRSLLMPIVSDAQFEASEKNKQVSFECADGLLVDGDAQMLSSAVENVVRNAVKYARSAISVNITASQRQLLISIGDDGKGIEQSQLERIFEPFYRESLARDRNSGGVGLGLAIAHQAILQHQGKIQASNKESGGLLVTIQLPQSSKSL